MNPTTIRHRYGLMCWYRRMANRHLMDGDAFKYLFYIRQSNIIARGIWEETGVDLRFNALTS